jgi:hypothetical protein
MGVIVSNVPFNLEYVIRLREGLSLNSVEFRFQNILRTEHMGR